MLDSQYHGEYSAVYSLGPNCQTAYQLRRLGLRQAAGPLDWFISNSHAGLTSLLDNRFHDFMELENMKLVGQFQTCYCIKDEKYQIFSYHDFPVALPKERWHEAYPEFHERQTRRQERFLQALASLDRLLFVRMNCTPEEALDLHQRLSRLVVHSFNLLIVNTPQDVSQESSQAAEHTIVHPAGLATAQLNKGADWRGDDEGWAALLEKISVKT